MIVLHVLTGCEMDVRERLIEYKPILPMEHRLMRINRVWTNVPRVVMPGYVFLDVNINDDEYYRVRDVSCVIRLLNYHDPLPADEAATIRQMAHTMLEPHVIDAQGKVVSGFFKTENLIAVYKRQRRAVFTIRLLNRKTTVTVSATFLQ